MAWGRSTPKPKRGRYAQSCRACGYATCRCRKIVAADVKKAPAPHKCGRCGRTVRGGVCPGPDC